MSKISLVQSPCIDELEAGEMVTILPMTLLGGSAVKVDLKNLKEEFEKLKRERDHFKAGVDGARATLFGADY